jgi:hypothetical protein
MTGPSTRARERFAATGAADASLEGAILASRLSADLADTPTALLLSEPDELRPTLADAPRPGRCRRSRRWRAP